MKDLLKRALQDAVSMGAQYADIRFTALKTESISVKNGQVQAIDFHFDCGVGLRVLVDGAWGFASNPDIDNDEKMHTMVARAVDLAKASAKTSNVRLQLAPKQVFVDEWSSEFQEDPFSVSLEEKLALLVDCSNKMKAVDGIALASASLDFMTEERIYLDTEGSDIKQTTVQSGGGISCTSLSGGEMHSRSYPSSFRGNHKVAGYEYIRSLKMAEEAEKIAKQAAELHGAAICPEGRLDLILGGSQLALQVHESCGHPVELDRVLGYEANFAGTSFLTLDKLNNFRYGSDKVNMVQDGTTPGALGAAKYDDEGVISCCTDIVRNGQFVGYLKSRDTAQYENGVSNGAARAQGWKHVPIVRMTNIHLLPGQETLDELISSTKKGLFITNNSSWSIDDKRLNFQFGGEIGWLIENGKITKMVKKPTYIGVTPKFWGACEGVASEKEWDLWGTPNCGKGQPMQTMRVGHGVSFAKFANVKVGVSK
jgi:TldD protein